MQGAFAQNPRPVGPAGDLAFHLRGGSANVSLKEDAAIKPRPRTLLNTRFQSRQLFGIAAIMNYALQVVRGRAGASTIKLVDGVNSIGRHDDCLIRIRSSQVSRRHCELLEDGGSLLLRDLGSSNGTYVNGKRVLGQQRLSPGDVITVGGVTLRVEQLQEATGAKPGSPSGPARAGDTAELEAIPDPDAALEAQLDDEEFEIAIEDDTEHLDLIPLDDETQPPKPAPKSKPAAKGAPKSAAPAEEEPEGAAPAKTADEEAAVAQFLMDLKLDEDD